MCPIETVSSFPEILPFGQDDKVIGLRDGKIERLGLPDLN